MSAITGIPLHYVTEFDTNWQQLVQQKISKLKDYVVIDRVHGKEKSFNQMGPIEMQKVTQRAGETRITDSPLGKRWLRPYPHDLATLFDEWDKELLGSVVLPQSETVEAHGAAYGRACDRAVVEAALGSAYILADGAVSPLRTVNGGGIELQSKSGKVLVGLPYISQLKPMKLETALQDGSSRSRKKRVHRIWEAALMTSAAQTFFPQAEVSRAGKVERYLDGGNVRNAPMACAAFEAGRLWWGEPVLLVHLGTGRARNAKHLPNGGVVFWAAEIFDCTTNGDDSYDDYFCKGLEQFVPGFRYRRFDVDLERFPAMDDASERTLTGLERIVELSMHTDREPWDALMRDLRMEEEKGAA